jgi:hypothetical protein
MDDALRTSRRLEETLGLTERDAEARIPSRLGKNKQSTAHCLWPTRFEVNL